MFCCLDWVNNKGTSYPGQRGGYYPTGGNALSRNPNYNQQMQQPANVETVGVTVPSGKFGGDQITVSNPDGNLVSAIIPQGMRPGDTFMVQIPKNNSTPPDNHFGSTDCSYNFNHPTQVPTAPPFNSLPIASEIASMPAIPIPASTIPDRRDTYNTSICSSTQSSMNNSNIENNGNQKLLLVKVPSGVKPGSTLNVQIPDENRMISAQVPPGVSEFHVLYEPMPQRQSQPIVVNGQPINNACYINGGYNGNNDDSGNYGYFNGNNNFCGSDNGITYDNRYSNNGYRSNYRSNDSHSRNDKVHNNRKYNNKASDSRIGIVAPVLAGAALMGGAGFLVSHHHNHDNNNN